MKLFAPLLLSAAALVVMGPTFAGVPGSDWMPADQVIAKLVSEGGYSVVSEIEAEHGHWEGEGMKNGVKMEFRADAKTGQIISEKPDKD